MSKPLRIFLVAGEPSGDVLGGRLMAALKKQHGGQSEFIGVGGPAMQAEGLQSLFPMAELSVMGIVEILPHARRLLRRMRETAAAVDAAEPDAVVTIDAPAFAHGVAKRIRKRSIPRIHYVAPQLWAWRPWRVHKFKRHFDHLLALLPFEPEWFGRYGMSCEFVGHPVVESQDSRAMRPSFREENGIAADAVAICVLLGSRRGEVTRLEQPFRETIDKLRDRHRNLVAVLPTVPNVADLVRDATAHWTVPVRVIDDPSLKAPAIAACDAGLAASGTATLELAREGVPFVVAYRLAGLSFALAKMLVRVRFVTLINLILDREVVPELMQGDCIPEKLAPAVENLLGDAGRVQRQAVLPALEQMGLGGPPPSERAAQAVLRVVAERQQAAG